jgi:hypothetical protein
VLAGLRVNGEGLRKILPISPFHSLFHLVSQSIDFTGFKPYPLSLETYTQKNMAHRAFLNPNKPCFLQEHYLLQFKHLQNERSLFDVDKDTPLREKV